MEFHVCMIGYLQMVLLLRLSSKKCCQKKSILVVSSHDPHSTQLYLFYLVLNVRFGFQYQLKDKPFVHMIYFQR